MMYSIFHKYLSLSLLLLFLGLSVSGAEKAVPGKKNSSYDFGAKTRYGDWSINWSGDDAEIKSPLEKRGLLRFSGIPIHNASDIRITVKDENWERYSKVTVAVFPLVNGIPSRNFALAIRQGKKWNYPPPPTPLDITLPKDKWTTLTFDLAKLVNDKPSYFRIYYNRFASFTGKKVECEIGEIVFIPGKKLVSAKEERAKELEKKKTIAKCELLASAKGKAIVTGKVLLVDDAGKTIKPFSGALVSNGDEIHKSSNDGSFNFDFEITAPTSLFVTVPDGYVYVDTFFKTLHPGKNNVTFKLKECPKNTKNGFNFIHSADIQYDFQRKMPMFLNDFKELKAMGNRFDVGFMTSVGDLTNLGKIVNLLTLRKGFRSLGIQFFHEYGGHDAANPVPKGTGRVVNYVEILGPYAYSWNYGGVHFAAFISEESHSLSKSEIEKQRRWLAKDLSLMPKGQPLVLVTHIPQRVNPLISDIKQKYNLIGVLMGHWHIHNVYNVDGIPIITSSPWRARDWGGFTKKCRIISYKNGKLTSKTIAFNVDKLGVVISPKAIALGKKITILTNQYDTLNGVDAVKYQITKNGKKIVAGSLRDKGEWSWRGIVDASNWSEGKYKIDVVASNAKSKWNSSAEFAYSKALKTKVKLDGNWNDFFGGEKRLRYRKSPMSPPLRLAWTASTGVTLAQFSSPIIQNGKVYLGLMDGSVQMAKAGVVCVDATTGKEIWRTNTSADVYSTVAASRKVVAALDNDGNLYCLNAVTGKILWQKNVSKAIGSLPDNDYTWRMNMSPLVISNDTIYTVNSAYKISAAAFSVSDGTLLWKQKELDVLDYPIMALFPSDGKLFFSGSRTYGAINTSTGELLWKFTPKGYQRASCSPVADADGVYFHFRKYLLYAEKADGKKKWESKQIGAPLNYMSSPTVTPKKVILSRDYYINALNKTTGKKLWKVKLPPLNHTKFQILRNGSSSAVRGDTAYLGSDNGFVYALNTNTGKIIWKYEIGVPIKSSVATSGNLLVVSAFDGNIYGFIRPSGK